MLQPVSSVSGASTAIALPPAATNDFDEIRQVIFALGVGIADAAQQIQRLGTVDRHQTAIAIGDLFLFLGRVLLFADRYQGSPSLTISRP